jgi:tRNA-dihydrouridine synthase
MQFYEGKADWDAIRAVRDVLSIPLVANGDVDTAEDAREILRCSGADAVMVGRGAQGRPWHPAVLAGAATHPSAEEIAAVAVEHYRMMLDFYGVEAGLRHARKHVGWYLERFAPGFTGPAKAEIMTARDSDFVAGRLAEALIAGAAPTLGAAA